VRERCAACSRRKAGPCESYRRGRGVPEGSLVTRLCRDLGLGLDLGNPSRLAGKPVTVAVLRRAKPPLLAESDNATRRLGSTARGVLLALLRCSVGRGRRLPLCSWLLLRAQSGERSTWSSRQKTGEEIKHRHRQGVLRGPEEHLFMNSHTLSDWTTNSGWVN